MKTQEIKIYTIEEHPNKEKCFEWIRDNWHDLNNHFIDEVVESLVALQNVIGGDLDWSISAVPDRGEFINFVNYDKRKLNELDASLCPLTGVWSDASVIDGLQNGNIERVLQSLHDDTAYVYSDEGLEEMCAANNYEFLESGEVV